jgi:hypothetical protein
MLKSLRLRLYAVGLQAQLVDRVVTYLETYIEVRVARFEQAA